MLQDPKNLPAFNGVSAANARPKPARVRRQSTTEASRVTEKSRKQNAIILLEEDPRNTGVLSPVHTAEVKANQSHLASFANRGG